MTQMTGEQQQQIEAAAGSVAAKLQAFHESLTADEQRALDIALRRVGAGTDETTEDAAGYFTPVWLPLIVVKIVEQLQQQPTSTQQPSQQPSQTPQRH